MIESNIILSDLNVLLSLLFRAIQQIPDGLRRRQQQRPVVHAALLRARGALLVVRAGAQLPRHPLRAVSQIVFHGVSSSKDSSIYIYTFCPVLSRFLR